MFGSRKILRKEKNVKEIIFSFLVVLILLKLIKNLNIFKLFNLYIDKLK